ncbi:MAG: YihA family ribosome biogenesis GTP-binding protein [Gammaproteobacteria bacterium]|nr:YihA family ribosome biogenesis GTP-binding protein [Gammaproteobacteria bacterium]MDE2344858.1 YihA family ribosome biogenesis GTP-binding protein [Gammaproteobacteria bacterium]
MPVDLRQARFAKSVGGLQGLPPDSRREVAFAGRSNAGKSSVLNTIAGVRGLARVSKTPGRTQLINYFSVADGCYLVDLPGYGYARVPRSVQEHWGRLMTAYFNTRHSLKGMVLVMDIRHALSESDMRLVEWVKPLKLPVLALLNKADKLTRSAAQAVVRRVQQGPGGLHVQLFSAHAKTGIEDARAVISDWLSGG